MKNMKNKMIIFGIAIVLMGVLTAFSRRDGDEFSYKQTENYIIGFKHLESIHLTQQDDLIRVYPDLQQGLIDSDLAWNEHYRDVEYSRLIEQYGADGYPQTVAFGGGFPQFEYVYPDYMSVDLLTSDDYDSSHPAGSSLSDIACFYASSPIHFIKSRYEKPAAFQTYLQDDTYAGNIYLFALSIDPSEVHEQTPVTGLLSELGAEDFVLLYCSSLGLPQAVIRLTQAPAKAGTYPLTLVATGVNGTKYSAQLDYRFGSPAE